MANVKISGLPAASTPLTGAELVPIVQSGVTSQTTINDFGPSIPYTPAGTGAVTTTVQTKLRETVSVKDFGAVGDGVTDDTAAISNALTAVSAGGTLLFPAGIYKVTSAISKTFNNGAVVNIIGYGAKIDGTSITGTTDGDTILINLTGARLTGVALGTSATKGAASIITASAISANTNDIALISSTDLFNPTRAYYYKGELIELMTISGTTLTPEHALYDSYTNTTTTVYPLSTPTINVEGLEIVMNANQIALSIQYSRNPSVKNLKVHGARYTGVQFFYCFGGSIQECEIYDTWYSGTGTSYNIAVASCQNFIVKGNNLTEARHCITSGGQQPCRNLIYTHNVCSVHPSEPASNAVDVHGNVEFFSVLNNTINGGVILAGINGSVQNNLINETRAVVQALLIYQEINSDFYVISDNTFNVTNAATYGIWVSPTVASISINRLLIHDNNIKSVGTCVTVRPRSSSITGCSINTLSVKNNVLYSTGSAVAFAHYGNGAATYATTILDSANNIYKSDAYDAFLASSPITNTFSSNDKFYSNRLNGYLAEIDGTDVSIANPYFEGNIGGAGNSRSVYFGATGIVKCINPVFKNLTYKAELAASGPTTYIEQGWYSATPTILNTAGAKLVNFYGALGRAIAYGTAAPTTGTWAVGDRVYNQSPSVGNPKSWVCTVAGTPGTWVSEGNL